MDRPGELSLPIVRRATAGHGDDRLRAGGAVRTSAPPLRPGAYRRPRARPDRGRLARGDRAQPRAALVPRLTTAPAPVTRPLAAARGRVAAGRGRTALPAPS